MQSSLALGDDVCAKHAMTKSVVNGLHGQAVDMR
jgi:hypothetical protein